jgi:hypothetical protein
MYQAYLIVSLDDKLAYQIVKRAACVVSIVEIGSFVTDRNTVVSES